MRLEVEDDGGGIVPEALDRVFEDDDVVDALARLGCEAERAPSMAQAAEALARRPYDLVLLDLGLPDRQGLAALDDVLARAPKCRVVVIGQNDAATAVGALRRGAADYVVKPRERAELAPVVGRALGEAKQRRTAARERDGRAPLCAVGSSPAWRLYRRPHRPPRALRARLGGTLFLDEIGELPRDLQPKLLRALEGQPFRRFGGERDVRLIAATNRELPDMIRRGAFREDLDYRLRVLELRLPAQRERPGDARARAARRRPSGGRVWPSRRLDRARRARPPLRPPLLYAPLTPPNAHQPARTAPCRPPAGGSPQRPRPLDQRHPPAGLGQPFSAGAGGASTPVLLERVAPRCGRLASTDTDAPQRLMGDSRCERTKSRKRSTVGT